MLDQSVRVAALFVEEKGVYSELSYVDPWPEPRDARLYKGGHPVVCHPPCNRWTKMARVNYARFKREDLRPGNDHGCFASALGSVNRVGGVLEHPATSYAWEAHGLAKPPKHGWGPSGEGWVCTVWQSGYGHRANKATWLYYRGRRAPPELDWSKPEGTHQIGGVDTRRRGKNKPTVSRREALGTPLAFRDVLIELAMYSQVSG
jgi:hypothetical protein